MKELNSCMTDRETRLYFLIDTNRINARRSSPTMNKLDKWRDSGVIGLILPQIAHDEAKTGHNAARIRKTLHTIRTILTHESGMNEILTQIAAILFPMGCRSKNEQNDVLIVYDAWRNRPYPLITADRAILRKRDELATLGIMVMTDTEAVALVEQRIRERDHDARADAAWSGEPLPKWVGKD